MRKNIYLLMTALGTLLSTQSLWAQKPELPLPWLLSGNTNATAESRLGTTNSIPLRLVTNNLEVMRITENGNVGIGTVNPSSKLHVVGRGNFTEGLSVGGYGISAFASAGSAVTAVGSIGITSIAVNRAIEAYTDQPSSISIYARNSGGTAIYAQSNTSTALIAQGGNIGIIASGSNTGVRGQGGNGLVGYGTFVGVLGVGNGINANGILGITDGGDNPDNVISAVRGACNGYGVGIGAYSTHGASVVGYSGGTWAGLFYGNVYSTGSFIGSDKKLKKNIMEMTSALDMINQLKPKSYEYREDGIFQKMNLPKGKHFGFLAQDLEQVLPDLVKKTKFHSSFAQPARKSDLSSSPEQMDQKVSTSDIALPEASESMEFKAVNYTALIPIMVKGMQELSEENKLLRAQLGDLKQLVSKLTKDQPIQTSPQAAALLQNMPNPVRGTTSILYHLPEGTQNAQLIVTDNLGRTIKNLPLNAAGKVVFDASHLSSGIYHYSLLIGNTVVETRKMTVQN